MGLCDWFEHPGSVVLKPIRSASGIKRCIVEVFAVRDSWGRCGGEVRVGLDCNWRAGVCGGILARILSTEAVKPGDVGEISQSDDGDQHGPLIAKPVRAELALLVSLTPNFRYGPKQDHRDE